MNKDGDETKTFHALGMSCAISITKDLFERTGRSERETLGGMLEGLTMDPGLRQMQWEWAKIIASRIEWYVANTLELAAPVRRGGKSAPKRPAKKTAKKRARKLRS